MTKLNRRKGK